MSDGDSARDLVTPGARRLLEAALSIQKKHGHPRVCINHWLLALLERHGPMAESIADGLDATSLKQALSERLVAGDLGQDYPEEKLIARAAARAIGRGRSQAGERDFAAEILIAAGYSIAALAGAQESAADPATGSATSGGYVPRNTSPTPALDKFGRDVTRDAARGSLSQLVGREEELQLVVETLCRSIKRNPLLVGPAGVGKTAVVEGLALRIVAGQVPEPLRGVRLVEISTTSVVAGGGTYGEVESRVKAILAEAQLDGIVLFIDEVHMMIGAGGREGRNDVASHLKPALARGDFACIAATTDDEFRRLIEPDAALARRFQPVRIHEPTAAQTVGILRVRRDEIKARRGVDVDDRILDWLVEFADQALHNRRFPDKAVDLLEQSVAHAIARGVKVVAPEDAVAVAQRLAGMPIAAGERLAKLRQRLRDDSLLCEADAESIANRLEVTLRGLDVNPQRPNAVILLAGPAAGHAAALATFLADSIYGSPLRVVTIDFSAFQSSETLSGLIGAPPGTVGYDAELPIHAIAQMPWCVVRCENVDACHPAVRVFLAESLREGFITDARSRHIYLSDAVVLLTARNVDSPSGSRIGSIGFASEDKPSSSVSSQSIESTALAQAVGAEILEVVDVTVCDVAKDRNPAARVESLLADLAARLRKRAVEPRWDRSVTQRLVELIGERCVGPDLAAVVDAQLLPLLARYVSDIPGETVKVVEVYFRDGAFAVRPQI